MKDIIWGTLAVRSQLMAARPTLKAPFSASKVELGLVSLFTIAAEDGEERSENQVKQERKKNPTPYISKDI